MTFSILPKTNAKKVKRRHETRKRNGNGNGNGNAGPQARLEAKSTERPPGSEGRKKRRKNSRRRYRRALGPMVGKSWVGWGRGGVDCEG